MNVFQLTSVNFHYGSNWNWSLWSNVTSCVVQFNFHLPFADDLVFPPRCVVSSLQGPSGPAKTWSSIEKATITTILLGFGDINITRQTDSSWFLCLLWTRCMKLAVSVCLSVRTIQPENRWIIMATISALVSMVTMFPMVTWVALATTGCLRTTGTMITMFIPSL